MIVASLSAGGCSQASDDAPRRLFTDDFQTGSLDQWTPYVGSWNIERAPDTSNGNGYTAPEKDENQSIAGSLRWTDYHVQARVTVRDDAGRVGLLARVADTHHYYEYLMGRDDVGERGWSIRRRVDHDWATLASGRFDYRVGATYVMRFDLNGSKLDARISSDEGATYDQLGSVEDDTYAFGKIGVASYLASATFDDVIVDGSPFAALAVGPWAPSPSCATTPPPSPPESQPAAGT